MRAKVIIISFISVLLVRCILGQDFSRGYLDGQNVAREIVGVKPLKWNPELAGVAQKFLNNHIVDCLEGQLITSTASPNYGQTTARNVLFNNFTAADAVASWVAQKDYYDFESNSCIGGYCGCYTQVVWRTSTHIGCARVNCRNGGTLVTCIYRPRGNLPNQRPY
ncbi:hypothetical protein HN51_057645 [Arachis hypogaea]|uniref:basic form of pathogenesis-related protein 1-like n=1 Tax=Arachis ipaensis TaxID=130454 RepID=UPI0007AFB176|nr:basic form of pathogenesis-related protein 1-like [Arachis ipaensis]XP_025683388.1 basic form of pathogenesis-related protein 1 [Arachis hypogaea]QHN80473.1 Basic form of pathogenesis-related protein [Arachis hypogaea]